MRHSQRTSRARRQLTLFVDPRPDETVPSEVQAALVQALADLLLEHLQFCEAEVSARDDHELQDHS